jgi:dolichol-phosphate mannosyltransferase
MVVPTYNEVENITKLVPALCDLDLPNLRVLIVDDDSPDGTGAVADRMAAQFPQVSVLHRKGERGFGLAYLQGFDRAIQDGAEVVGQMDADLSHPPRKLVEMCAVLQSCDVVLGSRYVRGGRLDDAWPAWRKLLSAFGNHYARWVLNVPVLDVTGGFRLWRVSALKRMPLARVRSNGYAFQIEMLYMAHRMGLRIRELPIYFAERTLGHSKMSLRIQMEAAFRVWQIRLAYRDVYPDRNSV